MVKGYVFANVWFDEHLYKIDPVTGQVVDTYNFAELYPKVCDFFSWKNTTKKRNARSLGASFPASCWYRKTLACMFSRRPVEVTFGETPSRRPGGCQCRGCFPSSSSRACDRS